MGNLLREWIIAHVPEEVARAIVISAFISALFTTAVVYTIMK